MPPVDQSSTDDELLRKCFSDEGLEYLGVAEVPDPLDWEGRGEALAQYRHFLEEGRHGTMAFLEKHEAAKYDPNLALEGCKAVIVAGLAYHQARPVARLGQGMVARYAWGRDYHKVILAKLNRVASRLALHWPDHRWRSFTDTAPLDERYWAQRAGASFIAKNTLAINHRLGSWFLLGEILTTRFFSPTGPATGLQGTCPSGCRRCREVCPTGALDASGRIDARKCISYLTIEHRGPIDEAYKEAIGAWLFGCDLCQEVCPFNLAAKTTTEAEFLAWKAGPELDLAQVLDLDPEQFTLRFGGSPVHRSGRNGLVRNACIVAANTGRTELLPVLDGLKTDSDEGVADAARWAVAQLGLRGDLA